MVSDTQLNLSVCVVCYHTPESQLRRLLDSLIVSAQYLAHQQPASVSNLFLIDNSEFPKVSKELFRGYEAAMGKLGISLTLNHGQGNVGYGRGHNIPINELNSDYHLILNPDVVIKENALHNALKKFRDDRTIKLLSPNATDKDGKKLFLCKRYPSVLTLALRAFFPRPLKAIFSRKLSHYEMRDLSQTNYTAGIPLISGCFMLAETSSFTSIGGFDEHYFLYFEDFDLSIRMGGLGEVIYAPDVEITHDGGNTARKGIWHIRKFIESALQFFNSHGWRWL